MKTRLTIKITAAATALALVLCGCFSGNDDARYSPPSLTAQPSDVIAKAGQTVTFEASGEGVELTYQWYYKKYNASGWKVWKGHDTAKTSAVANPTWNGMRVYCRIRDRYGFSVATRAALVSLGKPPVISSQPADVTVILGETAYFRVKASGNGALKYQWYYKKSNSAFWTKWRGHTLPETQAVSNHSWNGMQVFCIITDSTGASTSSASASVTVIDSPTVIAQPASAALSADGKASFSVNGGTEGLDYQWFCVPKEVRYGIKMKDHNEPELAIMSGNKKGGTQVYCRLNCPKGSWILSDRATISPYDSPVITASPQTVAAKTGDSMRFSTTASGNGLQYRWYFRKRDSGAWVPLAGYTDASILLFASQELSDGEIRCEVTNQSGNKATSLPAGITVSDKINIHLQPEDTTVSSGEPVRLRVATDADDARFEWYCDRGDGLGWIKLSGQTGNEFAGIADSSWHGMRLRCKIYANDSPPVFSKAAVITVNDTLTLHSSPKDIASPSGEKIELSVKATGRDLTYQWLRMEKGSGKWVSWEGQTGRSVGLPAKRSWHRMKVRCDITDCTGKTVSSDAATVKITDALDILRQPESITVKAYERSVFSVAAQGKKLRYQWYYRKRGMNRWHVWKKHTASLTSALSNPSWDGMKVMCVITDAYGDTTESKPAVIRIKK